MTIGERMTVKKLRGETNVEWSLLESTLQAEAPRTAFAAIKMGPALTVMNVWASQHVYGDGGFVALSDVLCSPCEFSTKTGRKVADPPFPTKGFCSIKEATSSWLAYQADPQKYSDRAHDMGIPMAVIGCMAMVEGLLSELNAPAWFRNWLYFRWPESGRYSHGRSDNTIENLAEMWAKRSGVKAVAGGLINDVYGERSVRSLVRRADEEYMRILRASCGERPEQTASAPSRKDKTAPVEEGGV